MATSSTPIPPTKYTTQEMQNFGFDDDFKQPTVELVGYDGTSLRRVKTDATGVLGGGNYATKVTTASPYTYVAIAPPGTPQSTPAWQAMRIDESSGVVLAWANGSDSFTNIATDLTALTYS